MSNFYTFNIVLDTFCVLNIHIFKRIFVFILYFDNCRLDKKWYKNKENLNPGTY